MIIRADRTGSVQALASALQEVSQLTEVRSVLILGCDANGYIPDNTNNLLTSIKIPVFGGIFPSIIHNNEKLDRGFIVAGLPDCATVHTISNLSDDHVQYDNEIDKVEVPPGTKTMIVLVDGLAKRIGALVESLFNIFALDFNYIGGGAGSLTFEQKPCLFTNQGLLRDCATLVMLETESGVGVSHGWTEVEGPFQVTESEQNVIHTLDWRPAFEVYKEVVEKHSNKSFEGQPFFELARSYPFGITKIGSERVARDPLLVQNNRSLVCVGEVPAGSYVYILTGDVESLVGAASRALTLSEGSFRAHSDKRTTLFIDCASRALFLEDQFTRELDAVQQPGSVLIGALTLGEIANNRSDYLEFYNKTSVVGVLEA